MSPHNTKKTQTLTNAKVQSHHMNSEPNEGVPPISPRKTHTPQRTTPTTFDGNPTTLPPAAYLGSHRRPVLRDEEHLVLLARDGVPDEHDHRHSVALRPTRGAEGALPLPAGALGVLRKEADFFRGKSFFFSFFFSKHMTPFSKHMTPIIPIYIYSSI